MKLQTTEAVEKGPGFKDLCRETQEVVEKCRQMLKLQHMKCIDMNVSKMETNIARTFVTALPNIASLLIALELKGIEIASGHCAIADLLTHHRDAALSFLNIQNESFATLYCKIHSLDKFSTRINPPLVDTTPPPAMQEGAQTMRGGNTLESLLGIGLTEGSGDKDASPVHNPQDENAILDFTNGGGNMITPRRQGPAPSV